MKMKLFPALAAFLLATPAMAAEKVPASEAASADPFVEVVGMFGAMFPAEPLSVEAEARLPAAREVVGYLVPEGSYGRLMDETFKGMFDGLGDLLKPGPRSSVAKLTGLGEDDLAAYDEETLSEIVAVLDPAYAERADIGTKAILGGISGVMVKAEPSFREGYAAAFAEHFTAGQLADLKAFFQTPTGNYYASRRCSSPAIRG